MDSMEFGKVRHCAVNCVRDAMPPQMRRKAILDLRCFAEELVMGEEGHVSGRKSHNGKFVPLNQKSSMPKTAHPFIL